MITDTACDRDTVCGDHTTQRTWCLLGLDQALQCSQLFQSTSLILLRPPQAVYGAQQKASGFHVQSLLTLHFLQFTER